MEEQAAYKSECDYVLQIELGLTQQTLYSDLTHAAGVFSDRVFCGCDLDAPVTRKRSSSSSFLHPSPLAPATFDNNSSSTNHSSATTVSAISTAAGAAAAATASSSSSSNNNNSDNASSTDFHGFLKLEGCSIAEASITIPHYGKKNGALTGVRRDQDLPVVLPQLVTARHVARAASDRVKSWLDLNGRPSLPNLPTCEFELLSLRREIIASRDALLGSPDLPLTGKTGHVERSNVLRQHPLHSSLPINVVMELVSFL